MWIRIIYVFRLGKTPSFSIWHLFPQTDDIHLLWKLRDRYWIIYGMDLLWSSASWRTRRKFPILRARQSQEISWVLFISLKNVSMLSNHCWVNGKDDKSRQGLNFQSSLSAFEEWTVHKRVNFKHTGCTRNELIKSNIS